MASKKQEAQADHGQAEVEAVISEEVEQGFRGDKVDPTPNEHYTVDGVIAGKPTPETDPEAAGAPLTQTRQGA